MWLVEGEREIVYMRLFLLGWIIFVWLFLIVGFLFFD